MADRTFTEGEAYALVAQAEERATAEATTSITTLTAEKTELETKLDVAETAKTAAEDRATAAEKALEDFKTEVESTKAAEAKRAERTAKVTEVAPKLELTEDRANRIVAMSDEGFTAYIEDIRVAAGETPIEVDPSTGVPRTSAALGGSALPPKASGGSTEGKTILGGLYAGRGLPATTSA